MRKPSQVNSPPENRQKSALDKSESFDDVLTVHTSPGGTQYVKLIDIILNDQIFNEMERLSQVVGIQKNKKN